MTYEIGTIFEVDGCKYRVVEALNREERCDNCAFFKRHKCHGVLEETGECSPFWRDDLKHAYFVKL